MGIKGQKIDNVRFSNTFFVRGFATTNRDAMTSAQRMQPAEVKSIELRQGQACTGFGRDINTKIPAEFEKRVESCRKTLRHEFDRNCVSTALFIAGEVDTDYFIGTDRVYENFLSHLQQLDAPIPGAIAVWRSATSDGVVSVEHLGIVTAVNPDLLITHRLYRYGIFYENQSLKEAAGHFADYCWVEYYLPRALDSK